MKNLPLKAHPRAVLALAEVDAPEALAAAFIAARTYNTYSHRFVRGLLEASDATRRDRPPAHAPQPPLLTVAADPRPYQRILEAGR